MSLNIGPKAQEWGCWQSGVTERSREVLPGSKEAKALALIRKVPYAEVAETYGEEVTSICEIVKKEKEIGAGSAVAPQAAKVLATVSEGSWLGGKRP